MTGAGPRGATLEYGTRTTTQHYLRNSRDGKVVGS